MSARQDALRLRLELLRMRAQIERSEIAAAVVDLQVSTRRLRRFGAVASSLGAATSGSTGGWLGQIVGVLGQRPWITAAVVGVLRTARRHPWLAIIAVGAVVIAARWQRRGPEAKTERSSEAEHAPRPSADETGD
ncbi:MAG: hypothetical protein MUC86_11195 [Burkholderiaceae bacterium]|jgi:hypothetical protein|nr:hypothetical protein [Burkholderiaceae bacterium]